MSDAHTGDYALLRARAEGKYAIELMEVTAGTVMALLDDLDTRSAEVDHKSALGHAAADAWEAEAHRLKVERDAAEADATQLAEALGLVLASFYEKGHPGRECIRTGWVGIKKYREWHAVLGQHEERTGG